MGLESVSGYSIVSVVVSSLKVTMIDVVIFSSQPLTLVNDFSATTQDSVEYSRATWKQRVRGTSESITSLSESIADNTRMLLVCHVDNRLLRDHRFIRELQCRGLERGSTGACGMFENGCSASHVDITFSFIGVGRADTQI